MSVAQAQVAVDSQEFVEWIAFEQIDPWGSERADLRFAQLCALTANMNRGKGSRLAKVSDFMFDFEKAHKQQSMAEMQARVRLYVKAHNIKVGQK